MGCNFSQIFFHSTELEQNKLLRIKQILTYFSWICINEPFAYGFQANNHVLRPYPLYHLLLHSFTEKTNVFTMLLLLVIPFFLLPFSIFSVSTYNTYTTNNHLNQQLLIINLITIVLLFSITVAQSNIGLLQNPIYCSAFPVAYTLILIAFILFIINRRRSDTVNWQGRKYTISKKAYTIFSKRKPFQS